MAVLTWEVSELVDGCSDTQQLLRQRYLDSGHRRRTQDGQPPTWRPDGGTPLGRHEPPGTLRLATEFIERYAAEPIGLTEIAAAARLSPRALQAAFRRHLDSTPLARLRSVRIERAHAALESAHPGDGQTVSSIASACGFPQLSRFARDYKRRYGRSPSETLGRPG